MTWTRLDDGWTDRPILEPLSYEARWHYLALIQFCSRTSRYDGFVRTSDARRCSDVPDPVAANTSLLARGLLEQLENGLRVVHISEHVPPPHMRDEKRKADQRDRKRRERLHKQGDHTYCLPDNCSSITADPVTGEVTRDAGTGRDGTGRDVSTKEDESIAEHGTNGWTDVTVAVPGAPRPMAAWADQMYRSEL